MMDFLVMDKKRTDLLQALARGFELGDDGRVVQSSHWAADFVKSKGNSQIFLLHGPPGVGKTFTAGETIESVLDVGDL